MHEALNRTGLLEDLRLWLEVAVTSVFDWLRLLVRRLTLSSRAVAREGTAAGRRAARESESPQRLRRVGAGSPDRVQPPPPLQLRKRRTSVRRGDDAGAQRDASGGQEGEGVHFAGDGSVEGMVQDGQRHVHIVAGEQQQPRKQLRSPTSPLTYVMLDGSTRKQLQEEDMEEEGRVADDQHLATRLQSVAVVASAAAVIPGRAQVQGALGPSECDLDQHHQGRSGVAGSGACIGEGQAGFRGSGYRIRSRSFSGLVSFLDVMGGVAGGPC